MKCFWCLIEYQANDREVVADAEFVYQGMSACRVHVNGFEDGAA